MEIILKRDNMSLFLKRQIVSCSICPHIPARKTDGRAGVFSFFCLKYSVLRVSYQINMMEFPMPDDKNLTPMMQQYLKVKAEAPTLSPEETRREFGSD